MAVIRPEIETDPEALEQIAIEYLQDALPGWEPAEGDLMTWLIAAHARMVAEERDIAADVPLEQILRPLGEEVHRILPRVSSPATVMATVSLVDGQGYTIPAGAEVFVRTAGDDGVTMAVMESVTLPPAPRDSTGAYVGTEFTATVRLQAIEGREGTSGNGLGPGNEVVPIRALAFIKSIKLDGTSTGGTDAETDDEYLERLVDTLALTSPVPILPADFAAIARMQDGVERALAIDEPVLAEEILYIRSRNAELRIFDGSGLTMLLPAGADAAAVRTTFAAYDPIVEGGPLGTAEITVRLRNRLAYGDWFVTVTPTTTDPAYGGLGVVQHGGYRESRERAIKLAVIGPEGAPVTTAAHQAVVDAIESVRELNWSITVIDPTLRTINVDFAAVAWPNYDTEAVRAAAEAALREYLSPARWGMGDIAGDVDETAWVDEKVVRHLEVAQVLNEVPGLRYVTSLALTDGNGARLANGDVELSGVAVMPTAGAINAIVTEV